MSLPPSLKTVMTPFPYSVAATAPLREAQEIMEEHGVRHLPVTDGHSLAGIVTSRDIATTSAAAANQARLDALTVKDAYVEDVYAVDLNEPLDNVLMTMADRHIGSAIVTRRGKLAGVFTTLDACRAFGQYLQENFPHPQGDDVA